jgi:hypothetical protein
MRTGLFTAIAVLALAAPAAAGASAGQSATGGGTLGDVTFSFNARGIGSGDDASGTMHEVFRHGGGVVQADVVCMHVAGTTAEIQGTITRSSDPSQSAGDTLYFEVADNGEPGSGSDQFASFFSPVLAPACGTPFPDSTIDHGNIQVRGG